MKLEVQAVGNPKFPRYIIVNDKGEVFDGTGFNQDRQKATLYVEGQEIAVNETCWRAVGSICQPPDAQANPAPNNAVASAIANQQEKRDSPTFRLKTYRSDPESFKSWFTPGMRQVASGSIELRKAAAC